MQRGAIAFMLRKFIARVLRLHRYHEAIPRDLRNHTRRGDAETPRIPTDQRRLLNRKWPHRKAVDQRMIHSASERGDGPAHRLMCRAQDVDPIDLFHLREGDRPDHPLPRGHLLINLFPARGREFLGVRKNLVPEFLRENHRGSDHRTRERTSSGFIDSRNAGKPPSAKFALVPKTALHRRSLTAPKRRGV